eukprot:scaffold2587_cov22-Prasinocladus_malaysianus.AAC.1
MWWMKLGKRVFGTYCVAKCGSLGINIHGHIMTVLALWVKAAEFGNRKRSSLHEQTFWNQSVCQAFCDGSETRKK